MGVKTKRRAMNQDAQDQINSTNQQNGKKINPKKSNVQEFVEAIMVAFIAAIILRIFLIQAFRIPTGSMKDTLMVGDFLLVNKFIYGVRTPDRIPLIDKKVPFLRLPAFKEPERGNIIVFKWPRENESLDYIKRCIALPGQTVEVRNGYVYVDGKPEGELTQIKSRYFDTEDRHYFDYFRVKTEWGDEYTIRQYSDLTVSMDNHGPVRVPKKGDVITFPLRNEYEWSAYENLIEHEGHRISRRRNSNLVYIDGQAVTSYTVKDDYYFMMGDNRDNSSDSRDWGFLPYENIVGEALIIYFSWNSEGDIFHIFNKIRWMRIGSIIR